MIAARASPSLRCCCAGCSLPAADVAVPPLSGRVVDQTGTLSASDAAALTQKLKDLETRKGSQVAVLIVPTTAAGDDRAIFDPGRGSLEDRAQEDRRRRASGRRQGRSQAADRGRLRPRGRAHGRHRAAHHRRNHHAALQDRRFCRRDFGRRRPHHPRHRRRAAAGAKARSVARRRPGHVL